MNGKQANQLLDAVSKVLECEVELLQAPAQSSIHVFHGEFRLICALSALRAAYAVATEDPCRLAREGKLCRKCPHLPVCNE